MIEVLQLFGPWDQAENRLSTSLFSGRRAVIHVSSVISPANQSSLMVFIQLTVAILIVLGAVSCRCWNDLSSIKVDSGLPRDPKLFSQAVMIFSRQHFRPFFENRLWLGWRSVDDTTKVLEINLLRQFGKEVFFASPIHQQLLHQACFSSFSLHHSILLTCNIPNLTFVSKCSLQGWCAL